MGLHLLLPIYHSKQLRFIFFFNFYWSTVDVQGCAEAIMEGFIALPLNLHGSFPFLLTLHLQRGVSAKDIASPPRTPTHQVTPVWTTPAWNRLPQPRVPGLVCPVRGNRVDFPPSETELRAPGTARRTGSRGGGGGSGGHFQTLAVEGPEELPHALRLVNLLLALETPQERNTRFPHLGTVIRHCVRLSSALWDVYQHSWPPGTRCH